MNFIDLAEQQRHIRTKIDARIAAVLDHGNYIMGPEVKELETQLADFVGAKHCLSCANGTDALLIALMALGVTAGDAVFVPSFTFASTAEVVPLVGATIVLVDIDPRTYNMDPESLKRCIALVKSEGLKPAVVIPVDLFGLPADYNEIIPIAAENNMKVISDSAQAFGATLDGKSPCLVADITTTSFFPAKPLGCYGDGGALFTENEELAALINSLRVHGKGTEKYDNVRVGMNSRLDTVQAAILLEKLAVYPQELVSRQQAAEAYTEALADKFVVPHVPENATSVWAQYTLAAATQEERKAVMDGAKSQGVPTMIYYPKPLHEQVAYKDCMIDPKGAENSCRAAQTVFSIPMHGYLTSDEIEKVIKSVGFNYFLSEVKET
ncbi:DegT/DnrJ/EryC1/StrS family aminotransferase [Ahrensia kielensis]|uniref:DegT/DnrJ/EryC1/StrS family aminotransferase n=1 Tax=Ahrensia kielensis TaxID=76980 RepID=A0ABU9T9A1_9HYPH